MQSGLIKRDRQIMAVIYCIFNLNKNDTGRISFGNIPKRNQDADFNISKLSLIRLIRESPISGKVSQRK